MGFAEVLAVIRTSFKPRKTVDLDDLHIEIEPLTTVEEVKVLEAIKTLESQEYIESLKRTTLAYAIKKINDISLDSDLVTTSNSETGKEETKDKYLFMLDFLSKWPSAIIDVLFDSLANIQIEVDSKIRKGMKFDKFELTEAPPEEAPEGFKKIVEKEDDDLTPTEKMNKKVEKEIEQANMGMAQAVDKAEDEVIKKAT